jgi:hypothetical protein
MIHILNRSIAEFMLALAKSSVMRSLIYPPLLVLLLPPTSPHHGVICEKTAKEQGHHARRRRQSPRGARLCGVFFFSGFGQSTRVLSLAPNTVVQAMDEPLCAYGRCSTGLVQVVVHLSLTQGDMNEVTAHFNAYFCSPLLPASSPISGLSHLLSGCVCARRAPLPSFDVITPCFVSYSPWR